MLEANRFAIDSIGVTPVQLGGLALGIGTLASAFLGLLGTAWFLIWSRWQIGTDLRNADRAGWTRT